MTCLPTEACDELSFVRAVSARSPQVDQCAGPSLRISFWPYRVFILEHILASKEASDILWDGFREDDQHGVHFELCAGHWMDLATVCGLRARQYRRADWADQAQILLGQVCTVAGWDAKEIANMFAWQRLRLT